MAIQNRRGRETDFDPNKMLPGEWAVSLDTKYVRMCFEPGLCLRMATYEAFEEDMEKIKDILSAAKTIEQAIMNIASEVNENAEIVVENTALSKQYMEQAKMYAENASAVTGIEIATKDRAGIMKGGDNSVSEDGALMLTATTRESVMPNSNAGGAKINGIYGASEQKQYSGKQLIPFPYYETTHIDNGIEWTDLGDGRIMGNGKATTNSDYFLVSYNDMRMFEKGSYILNGCPNGGGESTYSIIIGKKVNGNLTKLVMSTSNDTFFALEEDTEIYILCRVSVGYTANNLVFKPMIRRADIEDDTFEPYVGGIPSPSPLYPQPIEISEVSEIKTVGKNELLYPYYESTKTVGGITFTDLGNGRIHAKGDSTARAAFTLHGRRPGEVNDFALPNGNYILSGCPKGGSTSTYRINFGITKNGEYYELGRDIGNGYAFTVDGDDFSTDSGNLGIAIDILAGQTIDLIFEPMIRRADIEDDTFEPYQSTKAQVAFIGRSIEVTASDDYTYEKDGKYYIADSSERVGNGYKKTQRIGAKVFDGVNLMCGYVNVFSNSVQMNLGSVTNWVDSRDGKDYTFANSHFRYKAYDGSFEANTAWKSITNGVVVCYLPLDSGVTDIVSANTWLQNNNVTVHYVLAEPIVTMLTDEEVKALYGLKTFDTVTYISTDSEVEPIIEVEYGTSKVGGYALETFNTSKRNEIKLNEYVSRITELEALATEVE